jgi:hypothetical protein
MTVHPSALKRLEEAERQIRADRFAVDNPFSYYLKIHQKVCDILSDGNLDDAQKVTELRKQQGFCAMYDKFNLITLMSITNPPSEEQRRALLIRLTSEVHDKIDEYKRRYSRMLDEAANF